MRAKKNTVLKIAVFAIACLAVTGISQAQLVGPFTSFPSDDITDGRFLAAVAGLEGLTDESTTIGISVDETSTEFEFRIFDGDTFEPCVYDGVTCFVPFRGHWDDPGAPNQLVVTLYEDPLRSGDTTGLTLVGTWLGNDPNPTADPGGVWVADQAEMPDNEWWTLTVQVSESARAPSGTAFYLANISLETSAAAVSDYKVAANVPLSIFSANFGFEAGAGGSVNDLAILHPDVVDEFQAVPCDAATGCNDATELAGLVDIIKFYPWQANLATSTYDGTYNFFLDVPIATQELTIFDGDFDFGTVNDANGNAESTLFQNLPLTACYDDDDANTPNDGYPFPSGAANNEGAVTNLMVNSPADDNQQEALLRPGCVTWTLIDPLGNQYPNLNPSSNLEWERFVVSVLDPTADYYVPQFPTLPAGTWEVVVEGLDISNSNFWKFEYAACGLVDGAPVCPEQTAKIGDTVFADTNENGVQDGNEPGINGCKVNLIETGEMAVTQTINGVDGMYMFDVDPGNPATGLNTYTVEVAPECRGDVPTGSVGDRVWFDLNNNGDGGDAGNTEGEPGIPNVLVVLRECAGGTPGVALGTTMTDPNGFYFFDNLPLDQEYCTEVVPTTLPDGLTRTNGTGDLSDPAAINAGSPTDRTLDFGYYLADPSTAGLGNEVWIDNDGDGIRDADEPGVEGALVELATCADPGTVISATSTDGAGFYYFGDLAPDCYKVSVMASSLPVGLTATYDLDDGTTNPDGMAMRTIIASEIALDVDFGYNDDPNDGVQVLHCISDYTWYDGDRDGIFDGVNGPDDGTDIALPGVTVTLRNGIGEAIATAVSDANGFFQFCGLSGDDPNTPGESEAELYVIEITDLGDVLAPYTGTTQAGVNGRQEVLVIDMDVDGVNFGYADEGILEHCIFTTPTTIFGGGPNFINQLGELQNDLDFDFGCRPLYSVGDRVWLNANGDANGGDFGEETGIEGVVVKLLNAAGGQIATETTDSTGFYKFVGLAPGTYTVMVDGTTLPADLVANYDPDGGTAGPFDGMHTFTFANDLPVGFFKPDVDFGYEESSVSVCLPNVDFENDSAGSMFSAGDIVSTQLAGMVVSTNDPSHPAMIFDTSNPTGGDTDLGTPNQAFGGPGVGSGGASGPGANRVPLGKVLIISEDGDSSDPDDNSSGGTITFDFVSPVELSSVGILDIDGTEAMGTVTAFDALGNVLASAEMQPLGNNSVQNVSVPATFVSSLEIWFPSSGAVTDIVFCADLCVVGAVGGSNDHAFWMPGIGTDFEFVPAGSWVEFGDGTASMSGTLRRRSDSAQAFVAQVDLSGRTTIAPPGSPKDPFPGSDTSNWVYYTGLTATLTGIDAYAGAEIELSPTGPVFQVGTGASIHNGDFGAASWFTWSVNSQPSSGFSFPWDGQGDINVNFKTDCTEVECLPGNYRDEFSTESFGGDDGSLSWSGDWIEDDAGGTGPTSGQVKVWGGDLLFIGKSYSPTRSAARALNLSGAVSATLSFDWECDGDMEGGTYGHTPADWLIVEASDDGGSNWSELLALEGNVDMCREPSDWDAGSESFQLENYIALTGDAQIRFRSAISASNEKVKIDNVDVSYGCESGPTCEGVEVKDKFNSVSFSNNDGPNDWAGDWIEYDVAGTGPSSGRVTINWNRLVLNDYPNTGTQPSAAREVDLSSASSATLSFDWVTHSGVDKSDWVVAEISSDGGASYTTLHDFTGFSGAQSGSKSFDISAYASANTRVRFRVKKYYGASGENFKVDNLTITGLCDPPLPPLPDDTCADGKPHLLAFEYTGESCSASDNDQNKDECSGNPNGAQPVSFVATKPDKFNVTPGSETLSTGDVVTFTSVDGGKMSGDLEFKVKQGGSTLQTVKLHTSCSEPLNLGDQFGSAILRGYEAAP